MHATDIIAYGCDGAIYCEECYVPDLDGWPIFASDELREGSSCDGCGCCWIDGEWLSHDDAVHPSTRWATCESCNAHIPHRQEYKKARRKFRRLKERACPECRRGRMIWR